MNIEAKELQAPVYGRQDAAAVTAAKGANGFAFRLSAALAENFAGDSFVCSPYSVWLPLAALVNAADDQHKDSLLEALSASGINAEDINRAASRMLYDLTKEGDKALAEKNNEQYHNPLKIANAILVGNNVTLKEDFAQKYIDFFRGMAINVDFDAPDAVKVVNQWASDNTEGLITDIIQDFPPRTKNHFRHRQAFIAAL
jgi:serpin B